MVVTCNLNRMEVDKVMQYLQKYGVRLVKDGRHYTLPVVFEDAVNSSDDVAKMLYSFFDLATVEQFLVLGLNARNRIDSLHVVSEGSLTASIVHPREVFRRAILNGNASIILAHNHPSGDPTPSKDDMDITKELVEGGKLLQIRVLDHIIVGDGHYTSLGSKGLI